MPPPPRIIKAEVSSSFLKVNLDDGRSLRLPLSNYPTLQRASEARRQAMRLETPWSLRWPRLDYDLGVEGMLASAKERTDLADVVKTTRNSCPVHRKKASRRRAHAAA